MSDEQEQHDANVTTPPPRQRARRHNLVVPWLPNQVHAPTKAKRYHTSFVEFMEYKKGGYPLPDVFMFRRVPVLGGPKNDKLSAHSL